MACIYYDSIEFVEHSTVLGVTIDSKLTFTKHAANKVQQCWFAWYNITKNCTRYRGLNASSLALLFKCVILTKLMYAAPVWLATNLDKFKDLYARAILKISGATHYPPLSIMSQAVNIAPLKITYEAITVKFLLKCLNSDNNMTGLIHQIEESRAHRFYHHIMFVHDYLKWKNVSLYSGRQKLNLLNIEGQLLVYSKEDIEDFTSHEWSQLSLNQHNDHPTWASDSASRNFLTRHLLPRSSSRLTDTKVLSLLHGHDVVFHKFERTVTVQGPRVTPFCDFCKTIEDDHMHRLQGCPRYNSAYRDSLMPLLEDHYDILSSMFRAGYGHYISSFRIMAQICMDDI